MYALSRSTLQTYEEKVIIYTLADSCELKRISDYVVTAGYTQLSCTYIFKYMYFMTIVGLPPRLHKGVVSA